MIEGDDDSLRRKLDRAKKDPSVSPNLKYQLEKQLKANESKQLVGLRKEVMRKEMKERQKKLKEEMNAKGIQSIDTQPNAKQEMEKEKRKAEMKKQQGQTENPAQAV